MPCAYCSCSLSALAVLSNWTSWQTKKVINLLFWTTLFANSSIIMKSICDWKLCIVNRSYLCLALASIVGSRSVPAVVHAPWSTFCVQAVANKHTPVPLELSNLSHPSPYMHYAIHHTRTSRTLMYTPHHPRYTVTAQQGTNTHTYKSCTSPRTLPPSSDLPL